MTDPSKMAEWQKQMERMNQFGGGGGGGSENHLLDGRVGKLEAFVEVLRENQRESTAKLDKIIESVSKLPTRQELNTWKWQWLGISIAIIAIIVTLLFGGLNYLKQ